jgi:molybdopterin-guanine dinucleotide biosynthesis protein A
MGRDKALLRLEEGGPTLMELTIGVLAQVAERVFVIAPLDREYQRFGVEVVPDAFPGAGALGGIATGLIAAGGHDLVITACDHPFLSAPLLSMMASIECDYDALAPRTRGRSRQGGEEIIQTLHAIYRPSCLPVLRDEIDRGYSSSRSFFDRISLRTLDEGEIKRIDPELRSLFSANTPTAFEEARRIHRATIGPAVHLDYTQSSG